MSMYFYKEQGKQYLDLRGNLILSHNDKLVKTRTKSAGPVSIMNGKSVVNIPKMGFFRKLKTTFIIIWFVWSSDKSLKPGDTNLKTPVKNERA